MGETREFHIGDVLSVTTDRLVSPRRMEGIYDILNFMAGESVYTHQIPRVGLEAAKTLVQQHPFLSDINAKDISKENWRDWLDEIIAKYGERLMIAPMTQDQHERIDPLSELAEMFHPDQIIVVEPPHD